MRLFLVAVGMLALCGCSRGSETEAGAVRVEIFYATFRPGCLTVTALDEADASRTETQQLSVDDRRSDDRTVAVFRKADWSRKLRVAASAREGSCEGPEVASSSQAVEIPEKGATLVYLDLRAQDLDGDGFVSASASGGKGTDCDDDDARVYPGATETCDGKDSNCSGSEDDAVDQRGYYVDADEDGYGNAMQVVRACTQPSGAVSEAGDCHDGNENVHPGRAEVLCDGVDEDCDGTADDDFHLGSACETELGCAGTRACSGDKSGTVCNSTQSPVEWFADQDGDGRYGTSVGLSCKAQPDAKTLKDDCDEGSRFIGGAEVCDRLDNNCDGSADEGGVCPGSPWNARTVLSGDVTWEAVTTHGLGKAWLAGAGGKLARVDGATVTDVAGCSADWKAAWARPSDGRVFLGAADGLLGSTTGSACATASVSGVQSSINGMVGFERSGVTTVYAVTSGGHVLRWEWQGESPSAPVVAATVPANLRSIHGLGEGTLLAVGAESYQLDDSTAQPRVFRLDTTASGSWKAESLPETIGTGFLRGVSVVDGRRAYAVGDRGLVLARDNGTWSKLASPDGTTDLVDVVAFDPTVVLVLSKKANTYLHRFDGTTWTEPFPQGQALLSLDGVDPREQWAAGQSGTLVRWGP